MDAVGEFYSTLCGTTEPKTSSRPSATLRAANPEIVTLGTDYATVRVPTAKLDAVLQLLQEK